MIEFSAAPGLIVIEPLEEESTFKLTNEKKLPKGKVILCGDTFVTEKGTIINCPVIPGDIILHSLFGHQDFEINKKTYRIVKFTEILGKFNYVKSD